jgi:hypothetical protein
MICVTQVANKIKIQKYKLLSLSSKNYNNQCYLFINGRVEKEKI